MRFFRDIAGNYRPVSQIRLLRIIKDETPGRGVGDRAEVLMLCEEKPILISIAELKVIIESE